MVTKPVNTEGNHRFMSTGDLNKSKLKPLKPVYCMECGKKNKLFHLFCYHCGADLEKAKIVIINKFKAMKTKKRSRYIPKHVKKEVWNRDDGKCVECGSNEELQFDHIIPFSKGGANTPQNLQILCASCNRKKYNKIDG